MKAVVVSGGDLVAGDEGQLEDAGLVVAADGGAARLAALARRPDVLVGDLDSLDATFVERLAAAGTRIVRRPREKDETDAELAVDAAIAAGADEIILLGALGGDRPDHALANVLLLATARVGSPAIRIVQGRSTVRSLASGSGLELEAVGATVSLLPLGGDVHGVTTRGLRYPLDDATLGAGRTRGVSNLVERLPASVSVRDGTLLVIEMREGPGQ